MRLVPEEPNLPNPDGPGAFGPLHNTLTLECLRFITTEKRKAGLVAVLVDETGKEFKVQAGEYVGENSGRISKIEPNRITVVQLVKDPSGDWIEVPRYLFKDVPQ
jgi:Tfp pilus assembly protein PilP